MFLDTRSVMATRLEVNRICYQHDIKYTTINRPDETICLWRSHPTVVQWGPPLPGTKAFFVWVAVIKHVDPRVTSADPSTLCLLGVTPRSVQLIALLL